VATFAASFATGPTFDEERRVAAVRRAATLLRNVASSGAGALRGPAASGAVDDLGPYGVLPGFVSAWLGEVLRSLHLVDTLTALRFGFLIITALAPWALFAVLERGLGARVALLGAVLLLSVPRWLHGAGVALEPVVVASLWLLVLAAYFRSLPSPVTERRGEARRRFRLAAVLFGVTLGVGFAVDRATLWVLPVVLIHHAATRGRSSLGELRRGRAPIPLALLLAVPVAPVFLVLCEPRIWRGGASAAAWLFAGLGPSIEPAAYGGRAVTPKDVPGFYGAEWLLSTVPVVLLLLAAAGAFFWARDWWRRRREAGRGEAGRGSACRLGVLALIVAGAILLGPALAPRVFVRFPPRAEAFLPLVAAFAAVALDRLANRIVGSARAPWLGAAAAVAALGTACIGLPTAGASFNLVAGGTGGAVVRRRFPVGDGSELAVLARSIDSLRFARVSVQATDVPKGYFGLLHQVERMKTKVESPRGASPGELIIVRGDKGGAVAKVTHWGGVIWQMSKR
jgi:hypothetical protein